jgi:hypothetical protein
MMIETRQVPDELKVRLDRMQRNALIAVVVGLVLVVIGVLVDRDQVFQSYLFSYLFWLGISLGCLVWLLVHGVTGGRWGEPIHPLLESSALMVVLMALLFVPLLFGLDHLYIWTRPDVVAQDVLLQGKEPYLNIPFFVGRAVLYFVIWAGTIALLNRWWRRLAQRPTLALAERLRRFSGIGLALYGLTITFAAVDWLMSLDPHWFSTIFGVLVTASQSCAALAFIIMVIAYLVHVPPFSEIVTQGHFSDLGNLLLTSVIFWTYIAYAQFFIIWSGDLPEEVPWYLDRLAGGWSWVAVVIIFLHFLIPFALLLSGQIKRNSRRLAGVAFMLLAADLIYLYWLVEPTFSGHHFALHWLDIVMPIFLGALWIAAFVWSLRRQVTRSITVTLPDAV